MTENTFEISNDGINWEAISIISAEFFMRFNSDPFMLCSHPELWPSHPLEGVTSNGNIIWIQPRREN